MRPSEGRGGPDQVHGKALPAGASRLSAEGTSKLIEAGRTTASDYGLTYAVIVAGAERATTEAMAHGAPVDAAGKTAYALEISGANGETCGTGAGALALFASGAGLRACSVAGSSDGRARQQRSG